MSKTAIYSCTCKNEYQDKRYGFGRRVFNDAAKGWRCSVCSNVKGKATDGKK